MWKPFSALPNYLGGKQRLCPAIFGEIKKFYPPRDWPSLTFVDAFMGGGSVALYAKAQGFRVLANDLAWRCYVVGKAVVENNDQTLTDELVNLLFQERNGYEPWIERHCVPHVFGPEIARFLDQALANAEKAEVGETSKALLYAALIRYMLMIRLAGQITNRAWSTNMTLGQYDNISQGQLKSGYAKTFLQPIPVRMRRVQQHINGGIFQGHARVFNEDSIAWLPQQWADLVYLDPPYLGSSSYESNYYLLDCILARRYLPRQAPSPFNRRETAWLSLTGMFEAVNHIPLWVFSFADNPEMGFTKEQLCGLIHDLGRETHVASIKHRWSLATESDHYEAGAKELLILCPK